MTHFVHTECVPVKFVRGLSEQECVQRLRFEVNETAESHGVRRQLGVPGASVRRTEHKGRGKVGGNEGRSFSLSYRDALSTT